MDKWGRKGGVIYCASLSILGGVLECASQNIGMFIASRFFAGGGSWGFLALSMSALALAGGLTNNFSTRIYRRISARRAARILCWDEWRDDRHWIFSCKLYGYVSHGPCHLEIFC